MGLKGCIAVKKPLLRNGNKQKRRNFAPVHQNWTPEMWSNVLWTGESKLETFRSKEWQYVCRQSNERPSEPCLQRSMQVWGCITTSEVGDLVLIECIVNADKYIQILTCLDSV